MQAPPATGTEAPLRDWSVGLVCVGSGRPALRRAFARAGAEVSTLPALSLRATPDRAGVRAHLQSLADAGTWIFVSPAAVRFTWRAWPGFAPARSTRVFAVGPGTAAALSRRGVAALHPSQRHDSEGLLALPELEVAVGKAALVKAPGGRALLADALRARGLEVEEVAPYRRAPARWDRRHRARLDAVLRAAPHAFWVATSGEALTALTRLSAHSLDAVLRMPLVVSSARLSAHAAALGFDEAHVAAGQSPAALLAAAIAVARKCAHVVDRVASR